MKIHGNSKQFQRENLANIDLLISAVNIYQMDLLENEVMSDVVVLAVVLEEVFDLD